VSGEADRAGLRGTWYVLPTPFAEDGSLDTTSLARLVEAAIGWGVDGLTAMGVMGEPAALTADERTSALRTVLDVAHGRVPVAVGCSGASPASVQMLIGQACELGAAAAMVAAPSLLRNVDLLPAFYAEAAGAGLPLIIQDEPAATGVLIPTSTLLASVDASGAAAVKLEDPPTPPKISRLLAARPDLAVFGGLGGVSALYELRRGACGTMTGFAFPEILRHVRASVENGDLVNAARCFDRYLPLIQFESQPIVGLAIRKEVLKRRGVLASSRTRGLSPVIDAVTAAELDDVLERVGIKPDPAPFQPWT
jgi:4-hydroxy-tetrahydrodipicolinate synthase